MDPRPASRTWTSVTEPVVSLVTWLVFLTALTLVCRVASEVMAAGGFCARGGPYVIETGCSGATTLFGAVAIPALLVALFVHAAVVNSWGPSLPSLFWPVLFTALGWVFLHGAQFDRYPRVMAYVLGVSFIVMSGSPFLLLKMLRRRFDWGVFAFRAVPAAAQPDVRVTLDGAGRPVVTRDGPTVRPGVTDVVTGMVLLGICAVAAVAIADALYAAV